MNRQQRRQAIRNGMNPKQAIDTTLREEFERGFAEGIKHCNEVWFYMVAYVLSAYKSENVYMSKAKLHEIMKRIISNIDEFRTGELDGRTDFELIKQEVEELRNKDEVISNDK